MARMNVSLKDSLVEELRRLVPVRQRSQFIAQAVREKLDHLEQEQAVHAAVGAWSQEDRATPEKEIRALRGAWHRRQSRLEESGG